MVFKQIPKHLQVYDWYAYNSLIVAVEVSQEIILGWSQFFLENNRCLF